MSEKRTGEPALEMLHISKRFGNSPGIADFSLRLEKGKIHGVLGESRTGKTALARMLGGLCAPDSGDIQIESQDVDVRNPRIAAAWGIGFAGEESPYVAGLSLIDHLLLGSEYAPSGKLGKRAVRREAPELCERYGIPLDLTLRAEEMTRADWLWLEILRMVLQERDILVLDEPDAVFTQQEMDRLSDVLRKICKNGSAALLLSRRPETMADVCEYVTVLLPGGPAETYLSAAAPPEDLARLIRGGDAAARSVEKKEISLGRMVLEARRLSVRDTESAAGTAYDLSFEIRGGEIVCLLGQPNESWDALAAALTGANEASGGQIKLDGKDISRASVRERMKEGIAYLPRNIRELSVVGSFTLEENLALNRYREFQESGWVKRRERRNKVEPMLEASGVRIGTGLDSLPDELDEETLYRVLLARELERKPLLMIVEEPTRHVSEQTAAFIREQLLSVRASRRAVLLLTSRAEEAMRLADRILVAYQGEIMGEFDPAYTSARELGWYMSGKWRQQRYGGSAVEEDEE